MVKTFLGSTTLLAALLLMTGCGLGPAAPSAAAAAAPEPRKAVNVDVIEGHSKAAPLYPTRQPSEKDRKAAVLLFLLRGNR
jgi:hypothetical protein